MLSLFSSRLLLEVATPNTHFTNREHSKQQNGVSMSSLLAPIITDTLMIDLERKLTKKATQEAQSDHRIDSDPLGDPIRF